MIDWRHGAAALIAVVLLGFLAPVGPSGDSIEYVALARQIAHRASVSFSDEEAAAAGVSDSSFVGRDGRRDLWHFWFYPALAAPLVRVGDAMGADVHRAFALLNGALLSGLALILASRVGSYWTIVFVAGPIIWWVPHAQVEVFTFVGIAVGCALLASRPALAALAFGLASTQNPPIATAMLMAIARAVAIRSTGRTDVLVMLLAVACSALHPAYYLWHLARPTPLLASAEWRLPPAKAVASPLLDLNFGLVWCAPVATAILVWSVMRKSAAMLRVWVVACGAWFLVAFAQAPNVNHGGTPSLSRYALWLIPLPLVTVVAAPPANHRLAAVLAVATALWTALFFSPSKPESHLRPSLLAAWVWQSYPAWDNPLPEVFAERLRHREPAYAVAATPNCAKVLTTEGTWPVGCSSVPVPDRCAEAGAICYGNRRRDGAYDFVVVPRR